MSGKNCIFLPTDDTETRKNSLRHNSVDLPVV